MFQDFKYFITPPLVISTSDNYYKTYRTYSEYNYLRPGISSKIKLLHFEAALACAKDYFHRCNVIDYGCADGPFLPSLSKYFNNVTGVDLRQDRINIAQKLLDDCSLKNVALICEMDAINVKRQLNKGNNKVLFLLETLEHIGMTSCNKNVYDQRIDFINSLFALLDDDGIIILSVPKMVGLSLLFQYLGLKILGQHTEPITIKNLFKASIFNDTLELEKNCIGTHLGFNFKTMKKYMDKNYHMIDKKDLIFQMVYVIKKNPVS
jgi:2-polyprenyl-3-methyl-5-hydroxy-6-metoxy-1,4-benzoquinol methylase